MSWNRALFPDPPRDFAGRRVVKIVLRAVHATLAGVYAGAIVFDVAPDLRSTWALWAITSGFALLAIDLHESFTILLQVRGLVVLAKIATLALLPFLGRGAVLAIVLVMLAASISSHAPSRWRYRLVFGRGLVRPSTSRG